MPTWTEADLRRLRTAQARRATRPATKGGAKANAATPVAAPAAASRGMGPSAPRRPGPGAAPRARGAAPRRAPAPRCIPAADSAAPLPGGGFVLTLRDLPPSLNDWQRWHWTRRREEMMRLAGVVRALAMSSRLPHLGAAEARVRSYFPDRRRRDPTNYAHWKPLWDALVRAGVLDDDDAAHLRVVAFDLLVDPERPRSEVEVRSLERRVAAPVAPTP